LVDRNVHPPGNSIRSHANSLRLLFDWKTSGCLSLLEVPLILGDLRDLLAGAFTMLRWGWLAEPSVLFQRIRAAPGPIR
jgi:hypothetical protein